jgi:hypothetical protein
MNAPYPTAQALPLRLSLEACSAVRQIPQVVLPTQNICFAHSVPARHFGNENAEQEHTRA